MGQIFSCMTKAKKPTPKKIELWQTPPNNRITNAMIRIRNSPPPEDEVEKYEVENYKLEWMYR